MTAIESTLKNAITLSKGSPVEQIKAYFKGILKLSQSAEEFPVDLDDVWGLAYSTNGNAIKSLKSDFMENIDYKVFIQNDKNLSCGRPTNKYMLSVQCLEYFIVRKMRPLFEVYRAIFHKAMQNVVPMSFSQALFLAAEKQKKIEEQQRLIAEKMEQLDESKEWYSINRWAMEHNCNWRSYNWRALKVLSFEFG